MGRESSNCLTLRCSRKQSISRAAPPKEVYRKSGRNSWLRVEYVSTRKVPPSGCSWDAVPVKTHGKSLFLYLSPFFKGNPAKSRIKLLGQEVRANMEWRGFP